MDEKLWRAADDIFHGKWTEMRSKRGKAKPERGWESNPMITEAGWVWHFNGFDKEGRNNVMKQVWDMTKDNYETE